MHDMRRVDLDFLDTAQFRVEVTQSVQATGREVFDYLKVAENWPIWHTQITDVEWTSPEPFGEGTTRTVRISDRYTAHEDFILWDEGRRFVFRFLESDIPFATALAEDFELRDLPEGGCEFRWTVAGEVAGLLRLLTPVLRAINGRAIRKTASQLAAQFNETPST